jgi:cytoskeletal protein RodZ
MLAEDSAFALSSVRRNRGVSLEQIAESTKISIRWLRAIEGGEFRKLPGGIYDTNYIRQYAKAIDYDEAELLAEYRRAVGATADAQDPAPRRASKGLFRSISIVSGGF